MSMVDNVGGGRTFSIVKSHIKATRGTLFSICIDDQNKCYLSISRYNVFLSTCQYCLSVNHVEHVNVANTEYNH